jgi:hypothetical protein
MRKLIFILIVCLIAAPTKADLFGFARITSNTSDPVGAQLCVDVSSYGTTQVLFRFYNDGPALSPYDVESPILSSICDVYFDDGALLGIASIDNPTGVSFSQLATPKDLSGGQNLSPPFVTTLGFSADSDPPVEHYGVNPGESVGIVFDLQDGKTFGDVIRAINVGFCPSLYYDGQNWSEDSLRIGIRVQAIGDSGDSDSFIMTPIPGAVLLGMLGFCVAGLKLRKSK